MGNFKEDRMDSIEKKISVYLLHRMHRDGRLRFPADPRTQRKKCINRSSKAVEALLMGIMGPTVYASELQDGCLLVLDNDDGLHYLLGFLEGGYPLEDLEFYPELNGCDIKRMEQEFPRATSLLMDSLILLQIIEYTTPRYMHMQVGSYIKKWSFAREQYIRNILYGWRLEDQLHDLAQRTKHASDHLGRRDLDRQYMMLRILMYHFISEGRIPEEQTGYKGLQKLLGQTADILERESLDQKEHLAGEICSVTKALLDWSAVSTIDLAKERGKEYQARRLGYLYTVIWMCSKRHCPISRNLDQIAHDSSLWQQIFSDTVNDWNIRKHLDMIEKRLI